MLPTPVSFKRRPYRKPSISGPPDNAWRHRLRLLFARSRVTNLAVLLLTASLIFSLFTNFLYWTESGSYSRRWDPSFAPHDDGTCSTGRHGSSSECAGSGRVHSIEDTITRTKELQALQHLIIVPGHGVWQGYTAETIYNESAWALEHYQQGDGARTRIDAFVGHIRKGVELADADRASLLVFSGGATRPSTTATEATSYLSLAVALSLLSPSSVPYTSHQTLSTFARSATEEYALDSFQNLLFSIARFREVTGHYPSRVTIVGYAMKRRRFEELHRAALRWPLQESRWNYVGIDIEDEWERRIAVQGEVKNGFIPYLRDLYGCHGALLDKRRTRNIHHRAHPYFSSAPEIASLLDWCPNVDEKGQFHIEGTLAKFGGVSKAEHEPDDFLADGYKTDSQAGASEGSYTSVFDGPLPWDQYH